MGSTSVATAIAPAVASDFLTSPIVVGALDVLDTGLAAEEAPVAAETDTEVDFLNLEPRSFSLKTCDCRRACLCDGLRSNCTSRRLALLPIYMKIQDTKNLFTKVRNVNKQLMLNQVVGCIIHKR